jgi:hypothetical protein
VQITRYASLSEQQFLGCVSAFADTLTGELNSAAMYLRKLDGQTKGAAFAFEMTLDRHRYGALTVLDRWGTLVAAFGRNLTLSRYQAIVAEAPARLRMAETILESANRLIDAGDRYTSDVVEACVMAFQSLATTFAEEIRAASQCAQLGPMLTDEFKQARGIFLQDLAAR